MNIEGNGELSFFTGEIVIQKISSLSWSDSIEEHNNYGRFGFFVLVLCTIFRLKNLQKWISIKRRRGEKEIRSLMKV